MRMTAVEKDNALHFVFAVQKEKGYFLTYIVNNKEMLTTTYKHVSYEYMTMKPQVFACSFDF